MKAETHALSDAEAAKLSAFTNALTTDTATPDQARTLFDWFSATKGREIALALFAGLQDFASDVMSKYLVALTRP